jgi:hypothetical protein
VRDVRIDKLELLLRTGTRRRPLVWSFRLQAFHINWISAMQRRSFLMSLGAVMLQGQSWVAHAQGQAHDVIRHRDDSVRASPA